MVAWWEIVFSTLGDGVCQETLHTQEDDSIAVIIHKLFASLNYVCLNT